MDIYQKTNAFLEECFHQLESEVPSPDIIEVGGHKALRYTDRSIEAAIIQKLARYVSGLNSSLLLLGYGYTQELGAIFRMLDEFNEDILFLCLPSMGSEKTKLHNQYLEYFYQEEFDNPNNPILSTQKRPTIPRKNIRSIIANSGLHGLNPHDSQELSRTLSQTYSGYVHGSSIHITEMIGGKHLKYALSGMAATNRQAEFTYNYWDYAYRGIISTMFVATALGTKDVYDNCEKYRDYFELQTGDTGQGDPEELMKKVKAKSKNA
jgi:hypothetical protein